MKMYRHGDVQLIPVKKLPHDVKKIDRNWLFEGEVTGHAHRIDVGELFESKDGKLYLVVANLTKVSHEEHKTKVLPKGIYFVGQKRQYNSESGWEKVAD